MGFLSKYKKARIFNNQLTTGANKWQIRDKKSLKIPPRKKGYIKNRGFFRFKKKLSKKHTFLSFQFVFGNLVRVQYQFQVLLSLSDSYF